MRRVTAAVCSGLSARLLAIGIGLGQFGLANAVDQHARAREPLHWPGVDGLQQPVQSVQSVVGRRYRHDEAWRSMVAQRYTSPSTLQCKYAAATSVGLALRAVQQLARERALHCLQYRCDQFRLRGQQHAQRDRQGHHSLAHWHMRNEEFHQVRCHLRHQARIAGGTAKGKQLVGAVAPPSPPYPDRRPR